MASSVTGLRLPGSAAATPWLINRQLVAAVLFVIVAALSRFVWFGDPAADADEQLYSLIGGHMLQGALPYVDLWDRKPIGLFLLFALAHWLGGPGPVAYQLLATGFAALGAWLTYLLARKVSDYATSCAAGVLYLLLIYAYGSFSGQSEIFFVPLMLGMALAVFDLSKRQAYPQALLAMLLGGLALQIKYTVAPQCLYLGCVAVWKLRAEKGLPIVRTAALLALVGLAPTLAAAGYYAERGHFDDWLYANFDSNFARAPAGRFSSSHITLLLPLLLLTAGGIYAAARLNPPSNRALYALFAGLGASALAGVLLPGTVYMYYYAAVVPGAILLALPFLDRTAALGWVPITLVLIGAAAMINLPRHYSESRQDRAELQQLATKIVPYVQGNKSCLFVFDGPTSLYRMTGSCLPSKFVYPDHLNNALESQSLGVDQAGEVARILSTQPGAIVTSDEPVTRQSPGSSQVVRSIIEQTYRPLGTAEVRGRTIEAWVRKSASSRAP